MKPIWTLGIINNSFLYLKFGWSISIYEIKIWLFLCLNNICTNIFDMDREIVYLKELVINP